MAVSEHAGATRDRTLDPPPPPPQASPERGAVTAVLLSADGRWPIAVVARELAGSGVPVFPCQPLGKQPLTAHGYRDATTDLAQVAAWWQRTPGANLGIPTGQVSGVVVVDVDVHGPVDGRRGFDRAGRAGLVDGWGLLVRTPTGGLHAYYPATPDLEQRSWQVARAGIDFRGDGGYIIAPPSGRAIEGRSVPYRVEAVNTGPVKLDAQRLRDFLDPQPPPRHLNDDPLRQGTNVSRLAAWVAARGEGERNRGLFWAACRLAENNVPASDALDVLTAAAGDAGLDEREITATVRSAYRTARPRPPQPQQRRPVSPTLHESSLAADRWFGRDVAATPESGRGL